MSNTIATIEADAVPGTRSHTLAKAQRWSGILAKFVSVQIIVQAIGLITGIFLVRMLSQRQYAYFTIANTMQGTISILADSGISIGLSAIGGKVWHDRYRFGQLINTALELRRKLATAAVLIVTPILIWILIKNGASTIYAMMVAIAVLVGVSAQLTTGVLEVVPRLHSQVNRLQKLDFYSAVLRLLMLCGAYLISLNAAFAVLSASVSLLFKNRLLRQWTRGDVETNAPSSQSDRTEITGIVKSQLPTAIFYCVQGQVTIWLIGIFGTTKSIAEIGAMGRLAVVFTIVGSVLGNIVTPAFARCQQKQVLLSRYWQVLAIYATFSALLMFGTVLFPSEMLWILGKKYLHLDAELRLIMASSILSGMVGVIWTLNAARAWVKLNWVTIPCTLVLQALLLTILNVGTPQGAIELGLFSVIPNILLNLYMSYNGFKKE